MDEDIEKIKELKRIFGVKTDEELAQKVGVGVFAVRSWKLRKSLPKKYELLLIQKRGDVNIHNSKFGDFINGDKYSYDSINKPNTALLSSLACNKEYTTTATQNPLLGEFCTLYEAYHTPQLEQELSRLVEILRKIKSVYESTL